jgi:hypothetical protein
MKYVYPYKYPVSTDPPSFDFLITNSLGEVVDIMLMSGLDMRFRIVVKEMDGKEWPLPEWENPEYDPYRVMVSTRKGLNRQDIEDDIIFRVDGLY